ncbi:hypothetical protein Pcinc_033638 [Petrolisthes cinctipes]|uniref:Uncharacterized protein n=1 Tax=Petrolisthes cinctipes TaxID=88211 RepID=A0AAE1ERW6_PETCI|nr:hypothetical protein Pcinc_033638 [Petrolisthes cinctipes]
MYGEKCGGEEGRKDMEEKCGVEEGREARYGENVVWKREEKLGMEENVMWKREEKLSMEENVVWKREEKLGMRKNVVWKTEEKVWRKNVMWKKEEKVWRKNVVGKKEENIWRKNVMWKREEKLKGGLVMQMSLQVKYYKVGDSQHCDWGSPFHCVEYDCETHTEAGIVAILKETFR